MAAEALVRLRRRRLGGPRSEAERALVDDGLAPVVDFVPAADFAEMLAEVERGGARLRLHREPVEVPRNTLIVTNTFGCDRRGPMTRQGAVRGMRRADFRSQAFRVA